MPAVSRASARATLARTGVTSWSSSGHYSNRATHRTRIPPLGERPASAGWWLATTSRLTPAVRRELSLRLDLEFERGGNEHNLAEAVHRRRAALGGRRNGGGVGRGQGVLAWLQPVGAVGGPAHAVLQALDRDRDTLARRQRRGFRHDENGREGDPLERFVEGILALQVQHEPHRVAAGPDLQLLVARVA